MKFTRCSITLLSIISFGLSIGLNSANSWAMSQKLFKEFKISNQHYSLALLELESGNVITKHRENDPMILASVSKLYTSYYALKSLGGDFQFEVKVSYTGDIKEGILNGDLYLKSNGAPYLLANNLISIIQQIKAKGINKVSGNFFIDDSELAFTPKLSELGLEDQTDNPSMGALNLEFNRFRIWNMKATHPPLEAIKITTKDQKANGLKFSFQNNMQWQINSQEKINNWEELPTRNSTMYAGHFFQYLANLHGLHLNSPQMKKIPTNAHEIASYRGLTLNRLAQLGLEYSNNLIAETLLKASAKKHTGKVLNSKQSAEHMHLWLKKNITSVPWDSEYFENGSGLTLKNKASALSMVKFLQALSSEQFGQTSYMSLLSINAHSGGIRNRLKNPEYAYRVYAKTGSLYYVNNLAGFLIGKSNKLYAFALFFTDKENRAMLTGPNSDKKEKLRKSSKGWYQKTVKIQDQILSEWIDKL